jgi:hypothetical protein
MKENLVGKFPHIAEIIKEHYLFGYDPNKVLKETN